nr:TIGR04283 family arsenosugar biosynthesis glycosyltransferase [Nitrospirota bacterium]
MISVIIPAYNEEQALPATLRALLAQPGDYEVIVVDGGSTDRTKQVCARYGFRESPSPLTPHPSRLLLTAPKGRASQMNVGVRHAAGEILLFLHADTLLPEGAIQRLNGLESDDRVQAGGFLHRFSGSDWRLALISFLDNFRCVRSRIIYGDQALFVRRALFAQLGGFPDQPILEDVAFCEKLVRVTTPILLDPPVLTDSRKFVQMGIWRSFTRVLLIILHVQFHLPVVPRTFFQDVR